MSGKEGAAHAPTIVQPRCVYARDGRTTFQKTVYHLATATSAQAALRALVSSPERVISLIDCSPGRGEESGKFLEYIANDPHLATYHAYILIITTDETLPLPMARSINTLAAALIAKPLNAQALFTLINRTSMRLRKEAKHDEKSAF